MVVWYGMNPDSEAYRGGMVRTLLQRHTMLDGMKAVGKSDKIRRATLLPHSLIKGYQAEQPMQFSSHTLA